jgi:hypothetical protein
MRKPAAAARPICPMCKEPGIHPNAQACIDALRATVDRLKTKITRLSTDPAVAGTGRWVPSYMT